MCVIRITIFVWCSLFMLPAFAESGVAAVGNSFVTRVEGTVTLVDSQRGLVALQNQTNALAMMLDLRRFTFQPGDRIQIEGRSAPASLPTITTISDYPDRPSGRELRNNFTGPTNSGENFICRMRGFVHPPESGYYRFWIASDDESELWLSVNANPARTQKIAYVPVPGWTLPGQWNKYPQQKSAPVFLDKAMGYYIEAVHVQHSHEDNLSVAWEGPNLERSVIAGKYLTPWQEDVDKTRVAHWTEGITNGILREYWTNVSVWRGLDLTGRTPRESIVKLADPRIVALGHGPLPEPISIGVGQPLAPEENFRRAEVEGVVSFAATSGRSVDLELVEGKARMQVRILNWQGTSLPMLVNSRVKLQGVCESVRNGKGESVAGLLWVPAAREIPLIKPTDAEWLAMQPTRLADLGSSQPNWQRAGKIRVGGTVVETMPDGSFVIEDQGCFYGYVSNDGTNWVQLGKSVEIPMSNSLCAGLAVCSCTNGVLNTANFQEVTGLPAGAENDAVGQVLKTGTVTADGSSITLSGSGSDINDRRDSFQFLHGAQAGDGEIVARVNAVQDLAVHGWARAGVMFRESLSEGSKFVMVSQTARSGVFMQYRINSDGLTEGVSVASYRAPTWVKLVRRHHRIRVVSAEAFAARIGQPLDIIGFFDVEQGVAVLKQALCRESADAATVEGLRHEMQLVSQFTDVSIRRLLVGPYLTSDGFRLEGIRIQGTVTFNGEVLGKKYFIVQDKTGAIAVNIDRFNPATLPQVGQQVRISGLSIAERYSPAIDPLQIETLGWGEIPPPMTRSAALATESHGDGVRIELSGVIHAVRSDGALEVATPEGLMSVWINEVEANFREHCVDATVRLRGVLSLTASSEPMLLVASQRDVEMVEPPPDDPFAIPLCSVTNLLAFDPRLQTLHRARIAGTVTWRLGRTVFLENDAGCARVESLTVPGVEVGDNIEAAGFLERAAHIPLLTQALVRKDGLTVAIPPRGASIQDLFVGNADGQLIRLVAGLIDQQRTDKQRQLLKLQVGRRIIEAMLPADFGLMPKLQIGSEVAVTGVCRWEPGITGSGRAAAGDSSLAGNVEILLRTPADVVVLQNPPWWTASRVLSLIGVLLGILLASAIWIHTLHRRVERRSHQLEEANARLADETRNAAVLAERQRLAAEIHDSLQQGFTGIRLQLDAANSKLAEGPEVVRRFLNTAQSMIQYSVAEVKSALWNWQSPALKEADLAMALNTIASQIGVASPAHVEFQLIGQPQPLSPTVEHHLLRIGQEGITNAIKHAEAKMIRIILNYSADSVQLTIRDDGRGFDPAKVLDVRGTHFGLSGLIGRARQLGTQLSIASEPGKGTSLTVLVPLQNSKSNGN